MKIWCGVYGCATVLDVDLPSSAEVWKLKETIFISMRYYRRCRFDPSMLTLYVACKDGVWVKDGPIADRLLRGWIDPEYEEMRSTRKLSEYFGQDFKCGENDIQILEGIPGQKVAWHPQDQEMALDPSIRVAHSKSIVRLSHADGFSTTALVLDRTDSHLYLFVNLHFLGDNKLVPHLSKEFVRHVRLHVGYDATVNGHKQGKTPVVCHHPSAKHGVEEGPVDRVLPARHRNSEQCDRVYAMGTTDGLFGWCVPSLGDR